MNIQKIETKVSGNESLTQRLTENTYRTTHPAKVHPRVGVKDENNVDPNSQEAEHKRGGQHCTDVRLRHKLEHAGCLRPHRRMLRINTPYFILLFWDSERRRR